MNDVKFLDFWCVCLVEFLGMGLLCFMVVGVGLVLEGSFLVFSVYIVLEVGFFIVVIIMILNIVSGGYVNLVISLGFLLIGYIGFVCCFLYIIL